jgi:hypothetical protein
MVSQAGHHLHPCDMGVTRDGGVQRTPCESPG